MEVTETPRIGSATARLTIALRNPLQGLLNWIDPIVRLLIGAGMALILGAVVFHVVGRYFFGRTYMGTLELVRYTTVWVSILGASAAFGSKEHVVIDALAEKVPKHIWFWFRLLADLILCVFFVVMIIAGQRMAIQDFSQTSLGLQIPMFYPYLAIPVGGVLMLLYTLVDILNSFAARYLPQEC